MKRTVTEELCGKCNAEIIIPMDRPSLCPACGKRILPCSTCPQLKFWKLNGISNKDYAFCDGKVCPFKGKKIWQAWDEIA